VLSLPASAAGEIYRPVEPGVPGLVPRTATCSLPPVTTLDELSAAVHNLPTCDRAALAVELIDSLGEALWSDEDLAKLAAERDTELESGAAALCPTRHFSPGCIAPQGGA
jgi:hypothetical protein